MSTKTKQFQVRNQPNGQIHAFDNLFDAIQFQRQTAWGRKWLATPMLTRAYPWLKEKGKR